MTELTWLGQMGLMIRSGDTTVCIDYYATDDPSRKTGVPVRADRLKGIDAFLGTHDHIDHIDHDAWKIWAVTNPDAKFIFPAAHHEKIMADGVSCANAVGMNEGDTFVLGSMTIHAVAASHEFLDRDPSTGYYPYLQYIIETEDVRIHHAGDTVRYEGMLPKISSFGKTDIGLLPINGRDGARYRRGCIGNMTYQEAADLAGDMGTKNVIPGHWDMFEDNSADPREFADYIDAKYKGRIKCVIPEVMKTMFYDRKTGLLT